MRNLVRKLSFLLVLIVFTILFFGPWFPPGSWIFFSDPIESEEIGAYVGIIVIALYFSISFGLYYLFIKRHKNTRNI